MSYQRLALSELFNDPFFASLGSPARALMHASDRVRLKRSMPVATRRSEIPVSVVRRGDNLAIHCELPGVALDDISVTVEGERVEIVARRVSKQEGRLLRSERWCGERRRTVQLPFAVAADAVQAHYGEGVLTIDLAAAAKQGERKIQINRKQGGEI